MIRVIGGRWRGRRLRFPAAPAVRPTADRLRETLFNWLAGDLEGRRCLDLFAGSGALAFEAASRGAGHVTAVEASREVATALAANARSLGAGDRIEVLHARVARYLERSPHAADVVFVDPPFARPQLAADTLARLHDRGWLAPRARIYVEMDARAGPLTPPPGWQRLRRTQAGEACGLLFAADDSANRP